jgi:hypothetical protein
VRRYACFRVSHVWAATVSGNRFGSTKSIASENDAVAEREALVMPHRKTRLCGCATIDSEDDNLVGEHVAIDNLYGCRRRFS